MMEGDQGGEKKERKESEECGPVRGMSNVMNAGLHTRDCCLKLAEMLT